MTKKTVKAIDALQDAQKIAFAPFIFQTAVSLRKLGVFTHIFEKGKEGACILTLSSELALSKYGLGVLLEIAESTGMVARNENDNYELTKLGYFLNYDKTVEVNMNFTHDVCYKGLFHLTEAIKTGTPAGLKEFGDWNTIYEGLSQLDSQVQKSWFEFDHHYSDYVFSEALEVVFRDKPSVIFDIGGNTGKFALQCVEYNETVEVTIIDLPGQLDKAFSLIRDRGFTRRISGLELNWLDDDPVIPGGADVIWMSQFLDCFSEEEILKILRVCVNAMDEHSTLIINETYTDRQKFDNAKFVLEATSLYFTAMANGNSKMYTSRELIALIESAGLKIVEDRKLGEFHTLFVCKKS